MKGIDRSPPPLIGESWEVSVEPSFPSELDDGSEMLADLIARDPAHWLGVDSANLNTSLLVKLLDTADTLSVQIHPSDSFDALEADQSGKPESWYVVFAEPGAGIYLGLRPGVDIDDMRDTLAANGDLSAMLQFVEVAEGDFFTIEAGTPHAIGAGLTLVEPQRVLPGRRGLTYRYWDWNRLYDADGHRSAAGRPRELHIESALAVTNFAAERGMAFVDQVRRRTGAAQLSEPVTLVALAHPRAPGAVRFAPLSVGRLAGTGPLTLEPSPVLRALTVVAGTVTVDGKTLHAGRSAVLAAQGGSYVLQSARAHAVISAAHV